MGSETGSTDALDRGRTARSACRTISHEEAFARQVRRREQVFKEMSHWYALYTKPKKEHQVHGLLQELGVEAYLPSVRRKVRRRDRPDRVVYFPCYLFARIDFDVTPRSSIDWMPGIRRIVCDGEEPTVVADEIISLIRRRLEGKRDVDLDGFKQGNRLRITSGPLRDLEAVFDQPLSARDRVRVLLNVMGRMTAVDIDRSEVVRI